MFKLLAAVVIFATPMTAWAVPLVPPMDTATFVVKSTDILVARCLNSDVKGGGKNDGLTLIEVEILNVLRGDRKVGKAKLATIGQPMEKGKTYLLASFGGGAFDTGFLAQSDQAVVELPPDFDLQSLAGRKLVEQVQTIFDARRTQLERLIRKLQLEKAALDPTVLTRRRRAIEFGPT
jgi:hypothetical protein